MDMLVLHQMPKDDGGWNCHGMTQKMLDAYYMNNGSNEPGMNSMYMVMEIVNKNFKTI